MSRTFIIEGQKYRTHPAADVYPMMGDDELRELGEDMRLFGQNFPIVLTGDGFVLDGRNRLAACELAEIEPWTEMWSREDDDVSPSAWVRSANDLRRHMNESQRALHAAKLEKLVAKDLKRLKKTEVLRHVAKKTGASERSAQRAKALLEKASTEQVKAIEAGKKSLGRVEKEIKRAEQVQLAKAYEPPAGQYPVIVVDPPWPYEDQLDGSDAARGGTPYPVMSIKEIAELELPLAENAAVFLWVTNSHLIDVLAYAEVASVWKARHDLEPKQIRTWVKPRMGLGRVWRNDTEHLVLFTRGRPVFAPVTQTTSLNAPLGQHSVKPQKAYDDILELCPAEPKLELFARAPRAGWVASGSELEAAPAATPPKQRKRTVDCAGSADCAHCNPKGRAA